MASERELDLAKAILFEAQEGGYVEADEIPDEEGAFIELAAYYVEEAEKWAEGGMAGNDTISAILKLVGDFRQELGEEEVAKVFGDGEPTEEESTEEESTPDESEPGERESGDVGGSEERPSYSSGTPPRSSGGYSEQELRGSEEELAAVVASQGLPVPPQLEDDPPQMPRDLTALSDLEVRKLHGEYLAFLSRAKWILTVETSDLSNAQHLREKQLRIVYNTLDPVDPNTDKPKLAKVLEAEANTNHSVVEWDGNIQLHSGRVTMYKGLVDIYSSAVSALSREWTMRQDEYNKTR